MRDTFTMLREESVRAHVGAESMRRAEPYVRRGALTHTRRTTHSLRAMVEGSRPRPYAVEVLVDPFGAISQARCSCPVGAPGRCKHVAVVLMGWLAEPEQFVEVEALEIGLSTRSREELEAMIRYMVRRKPALEIAAELDFPGAATTRAPQSAAYRAEAEAIFREYTGLGAASQIAQGLMPLVELARGFEAREQTEHALTIAAAITAAILGQLEHVRDDGFLDEVLLTLLDIAVAGLDAPAHRAAALELLTELSTPRQAPGTRERAQALLLDTSAEERAHVAAALRAQRDEESPFLLALEADMLDDATYLARCDALGLVREAVLRLVERERGAEALERVARVKGALPILELARQLGERGMGAQIEPLVRARYGESGEPELLSWLIEQDRACGQYARALAEAQALFWQRPTQALYETLQELAREQGLWEAIAPMADRRLSA
jgi:hypothetical protein